MHPDNPEMYKKRRDEGRCVRCGKPHEDCASGYRAMCPACREKTREYIYEVRMNRKKRGICTMCGKKKPRPGMTLCFECSLKASESARQTYYRRKENASCT